MIQFSNIWQHPRTSIAGILISIATITGVLAQHGVTLGSIGDGTVVSLAGALATALLGLLSRDPATTATPPVANASCAGIGSADVVKISSNNPTAKLSVWLLILLLLPLPWIEGCNSKNVANDIVSWTPSLQSAVATVTSTAALLDPADAIIFTAATASFDTASSLLVVQAKAYLADPSASALAQLQSQVVTFQQQVNASLLAATRIVNTSSQQHALAAIQAVATIVTAILSLVQSISSKAQVAQMAAQSPIKLATVAPYLDESRSAGLVAAHYNEPVAAARQQVALAEQSSINAGF